MTNYTRGVEKERQCMEQLETVGYNAMRTAGSHGTYDVIAEGPTGIRLIQIKRVKKGGNWKNEYEIAKEQMEDKARIPCISREIWVWEDNTGWIKQEVI